MGVHPAALPFHPENQKLKEGVTHQNGHTGQSSDPCISIWLQRLAQSGCLIPSVRALFITLCHNCYWASTLLETELAFEGRAQSGVSDSHVNRITYF